MKAKEFIIEGPLDLEEPRMSSRHDQMYQAGRQEHSNPDQLSRGETDNSAKFLGKGIEAVAVTYDSKVGVFKIVGPPEGLKNNSHLQYLLACKKYAAGNPYLPRVESMKAFQSTIYNRIMYVVKMEELFSLREAPEKELRFIMSSLNPSASVDNTGQSQLCAIVTETVSRILENYTKTTDQNLIQARRIINSIIKKLKYAGLDIHTGNIMIRRTQHGAQLVLNDPLVN